MSDSFRIGLTGSIGMGKSTTAQLFAEEGVPVWDADAAVHRLYATGGDAVAGIGALAPDAVDEQSVNRAALRKAIARDPGLLPRIEALVHPLVREDRETFARETEAPVLVFDIPLLFEGGGAGDFDAVIVVSAPAQVQAERVLARPGMTEADFEAILARQMPDAEKRARADFVIDSSQGIEAARARVREILAEIGAGRDA